MAGTSAGRSMLNMNQLNVQFFDKEGLCAAIFSHRIRLQEAYSVDKLGEN
jgi:hypothetical protein